MRQSEIRPRREQGLGEEIANSISHGIGTAGAIAASVVLIVTVAREGTAMDVVGSCIFSASMILLYLTSTLYHALARNRAKRVFRVLDHSAIYLLIAGTYTPFTMGVLRGAWGWTLFGLIWGIALLGIVFTSVGGMKHFRLSLALYLAMGWMVVIAIRPMWLNMPLPGLLWLLAGGLAYTVGAGFYATKRLPYAHLIWHLFIMAGTACHFVAIYSYSR